MKYLRFMLSTAVFACALIVPTVSMLLLTVTTRSVHSDAFVEVRLVMLLLFMPVLLKYVAHLMIAPWYPLVEFFRHKKRPAPFTPSVSVIIPAWNEEVGILSTIRSVLATRYPRLEIIVVNDGSTDRTHQQVTEFLAQYRAKTTKTSASILYKRVPNGGKARALNAALVLAKGEIVITVDSDSIMDHAAIKHIVRHFTDPRVASVAGNVIIGNRRKPIGIIQQMEYLYGFYFKRADSLLNAVYIVGGAAAAYRRSVIEKLGGFDETIITEDIEMSTRLQDHGYRVRYAADAVVYTEGPSDLAGLCRQRLRWKFGRLLTFYKYRHLFFSTSRRHNTYLCFLILPMALFSEILLFFEGILLTVFYAYTFYTRDFLPLSIFILLLAGIISFQILFDSKARHHLNLLLLAPGAWIVFYFMDVIEYQALLRSLFCLVTRRTPVWQRWVRVGVFERA